MSIGNPQPRSAALLNGLVYPGPDDDNSGDDNVNGTPEVDDINGGAGNDIIHGKGEDDTLFGGEQGDDNVFGGDGNDEIIDSAGHDLLFGGDNNDHITVRGSSEAYGGQGDDVISLGAFNGVDRAEHVKAGHSIEGGGGIDTLFLGGSVFFEAPFSARASGYEKVEVTGLVSGDNGDNGIDFSRVEKIGDTPLSIQGLDGDDLLIGFDEDGDTLDGGADADNLQGRGGADILIAGAGIDVLFAGPGNDTLYGGDIRPFDPAKIDTLFGGTGADTFEVSGNAAIRGEAGNDFIHLTSTTVGNVSNSYLVGVSIDGGAGDDSLIIGSGTVFAIATFDFGAQGFEFLTPSALITGDGTDNDLDFKDAQVLSATLVAIDGAAGDDTLVGTNIDDVIHGGANDDTLYGFGGDNQLFGDEGDDHILGGEDADLMDGGVGIDFFAGGGGGDTIEDTGIVDTIFGGAGNDVIELNAGVVKGASVIDGGGGTDEVDSLNDSVWHNFDAEEAHIEFGWGKWQGTGKADTIDLTGCKNATGHIQELVGGDGDDRLSASAGGAHINGEGNNDTLVGGRNATILGGSGNDDCTASGAGSTIFLESGDDEARCTKVGGTCSVDGGIGNDTIDFGWATAQSPRLTAGQLATLQDIGITIDLATATEQQSGVGKYTLSSIESATGSAFDDRLRGSNTANTLSGGDGNDELTGRTDADTLTGGKGDDVFAYNAQNEGGDTIADFMNHAGNNDGFQFLGSAFGGLAPGEILASRFQSSAANVAGTAAVRFFYETDTGILRFDADGNGGGAAVVIATLQAGANMTAHDVVII